jgi:hypothetical protein
MRPLPRAATAFEVDEMRQHRLFGGAIQPWIEADVHLVDHRRKLADAAREQAQDLALALLAVADQAANEAAGSVDLLAVRGIIDAIVAQHQLGEAGEVIGHVAVGRADHAGRPAHHAVAGEQRVLLDQRIGVVVRGVAGRGDRGERPAVAGDLLAVGEDAVGTVIAVERGIGAGARIIEHERRAADDRRAGRGLERTARRAVVAVRVGDEDRLDRPAGDRRQQRVQMRGIVGAGVDHREVAGADEVGLRAAVGVRRGIGRQHASDERFELDRLAGRKIAHAARDGG